MNIFRASDGASDTSPLRISDFPSLSDLRKAISNLVDIPLDQLILFLENGRALDDVEFERIWEAGGEGGSPADDDPDGPLPGESAFVDQQQQQQGERKQGRERAPQGIFAFDKESFMAEDVHEFVRSLEDSLVLCDVRGVVHEVEMSAGGVIEESGLPLHPPPHPLSSPSQTLLPFNNNHSQLIHLHTRMTNQLKALDIATGNLNWHWGLLMGLHGGSFPHDEDEDEGGDGEGEGSEVGSDEDEETRAAAGRSRKRSRQSLDAGTGTGTAQSSATQHRQRHPPASWPSYQALIARELAREESLVTGSSAISASISTHSPTPPPPQPTPNPDGVAGQAWGMDQDMQVIRKIPIHECFVSKKSKGKEREKEKDEGKQVKKKMLGDYVNPGKMRTVRDSCQKMFDDHLSRFDVLQSEINHLEHGIAEIVHSAARLALDAQNEAVGIVDVVERLVDEASRIAMEDPDVHWQSLRSLDAAVRQQVIHMTDLKNDVNLQLHIHLQQISIRQSTISGLPKLMSELEETLRTTRTVHKTGFPHLDRLRGMARAYGLTCVEVVWRKEIAQLLLEGTGKLAEGVAGFLTKETARRGEFAKKVLELLPPFEAESLSKSEMFSVSFDLSVKSGLDDLQDWTMTGQDIKDLLAILAELKDNPDLMHLPMEGQIHPLDQVVEDILAGEALKDRSLAELRKRLSVDTGGKPPTSAPSDEVTKLKADAQALQTRLDAEAQSASERHQALERALEAEKQRSEKSRAELEQRDLADQSKAEIAEAQERVVDSLRKDLAEKLAGEQAAHSQMADLHAQLEMMRVSLEEERAQITHLQSERSQILRGLSDARNDEEAVASRLVALQTELEATQAALEEARADRDEALKASSSESANSSDEQLAQVLQDRVRLEDRVVVITGELESAKAAHKQEVDSIKRAGERESDGLQAELSFARAQLREEKRKITKQESDLIELRQSLSDSQAGASTLASRGLQVASKYHDCITRLQSAIQSSATISGSVSGSVLGIDDRAPLGVSAAMSKHRPAYLGSNDMDLIEKELAALEEEDLQPFSEAVSRTMGLVKKWQKSAKQYRDRAKNSISFSGFSRGDLALFLPTRNATTKPWAAFNISSPHHFLKPEGEVAEQIKTREWIVARITKIEDDVAHSDRPESNPYGLADGIRYQLLHVEPYVPGAPIPKRRGTETGGRPKMPHPASSMGLSPQVAGPSGATPKPAESTAMSRSRSTSTHEADPQDNANNPFEGPARSNLSPGISHQRPSDIAPTDLPFALRPRGEGMSAGIPRRPPSVASSTGSFGRNLHHTSVGKGAATSAVSTTTDLPNLTAGLSGLTVAGRPPPPSPADGRGAFGGRSSPIGRRSMEATPNPGSPNPGRAALDILKQFER